MIRKVKLKYADQEREFSFGVAFIGEVLEFLDFDFNELLQKTVKNPFKYAPILMYYSLENTYKIEGKDVDFTKDDIIKWIDDEPNYGSDKLIHFIQSFLGSTDDKMKKEDAENDDTPKKK